MADLQPLLARAGLCSEVVEYGMRMGRVGRCGKPASPQSFYRLCEEDDAEARDDPTYGR